MSKRKRRSYTDEFRAEAVRLVTEQGYSLAEAAGNLGVHANLLRSWKRKLQAETPPLSPVDRTVLWTG